jgi:hypothetical protein
MWVLELRFTQHGHSFGQAEKIRHFDPGVGQETVSEGLRESGARILVIENNVLRRFLSNHRRVGLDTPVFIWLRKTPSMFGGPIKYSIGWSHIRTGE